MSLYIGESSSNNNFIHITNSISSLENIKLETFTDSTVLNTRLPIATITLKETYILPSFSAPLDAGALIVSASLAASIADTSKVVMCYIQDTDGLWKPASPYDVFFLKNTPNEYKLVNGRSSLIGRSCLVIAISSVTLDSGPINISTSDIIIGSTRLSEYTFFTVSGTGGNFNEAYPVGNGRTLNLVDFNNSVSTVFDSKSIKYRKANSQIYDFVSESASSRVHTYNSSSVIGSVGYVSGVDGESVYCTLPPISFSDRYLNIRVPYGFFYGTFGGGGTTSQGYYVFTTTGNSSFTIDKEIAPELRFRAKYVHTNRYFELTVYRQSDIVESYYVGSASPPVSINMV